MPSRKSLVTSDSSPSISRRTLLGRLAAGMGGLALTKRRAVAMALQSSGLAHAYRKDFRMGVAVSNQALDQQLAPELALIAREFNSVTGENAMKWGVIRPDGVTWQWKRADQLVDFARQHKMDVLGHTLVWHSQVPASVFLDAQRQPLTREALLGRMREHIEALVGRYKGRIWAWDVVNEAIDEDKGWRHSPWHDIIGDDFMEQAFRFAHAADPAALLLYNDYNMHNPGKVAFLANVLKDYRSRGVPIHGVGNQSHVGLTYPDLSQWERSIATFADLGLKVHITELDVDVLPPPADTGADVANNAAYSRQIDPWPQGLPAAIEEQLAERYEALFRILLRYRKSVERVTFWGLHDGISWKNNFPVRGRTNYPLLFDRQMQPKPAYQRLIKLAQAS